MTGTTNLSRYMRYCKSNKPFLNMKKTFTKPPVIPAGWIPKPKTDAYNFLDWLSNFQQWTFFIKRNGKN